MDNHNRRIRVLVVDDSAYLRKVISEMLASSPAIEVVGTAWDGEEALELAEQLHPDVITLDLYMPKLDGVGFLRQQMARHSIPVVIFTVAGESEDQVIEALEAGAADFVQKPTNKALDKVMDIQDELVEKVLAAAQIRPEKLVTLVEQPTVAGVYQPQIISHLHQVEAVVIGTSTGGPSALRYLLSRLPGNFPVPVGIVLHMPEGYTGPFAARLNQVCQLEVLEAKEGLEMKPGRVILAKAGYQMLLKKDASTGIVRAHLDNTCESSFHCPSVNGLFESAAQVYGTHLLGVIMTGMGNDGTQGASWIKAEGGKIITQDEISSVVYGMPRSAAEAGLSDRIVGLEELPGAIMEAL